MASINVSAKRENETNTLARGRLCRDSHNYRIVRTVVLSRFELSYGERG